MPTTPFDNVAGETLMVWQSTGTLNNPDPVQPFASVAVTVKL